MSTFSEDVRSLNFTMTDERRKYLSRDFTEEGIKGLEHKLKNLIVLYQKDIKLPQTFKMVGFPDMHIESKEEIKFRIKELAETLCIATIETQ